jgi:hypothetical protein
VDHLAARGQFQQRRQAPQETRIAAAADLPEAIARTGSDASA